MKKSRSSQFRPGKKHLQIRKEYEREKQKNDKVIEQAKGDNDMEILHVCFESQIAIVGYQEEETRERNFTRHPDHFEFGGLLSCRSRPFPAGASSPSHANEGPA